MNTDSPLKTHVTSWTASRHRLVVERWPCLLSFTVEAEVVSFVNNSRYPLFESRIAIPTDLPFAEATRLITHWLAFYADPELQAQGVAEYHLACAGIPERSAPGPHELETSTVN